MRKEVLGLDGHCEIRAAQVAQDGNRTPDSGESMTRQSKPISVVLADDHSIVREGLAAFCGTRPELHIAGQCSDGLAAVEMIRLMEPDFAIIDLHMPKLHGLEVIRKVGRPRRPCKLMVLSISRDEKW